MDKLGCRIDLYHTLYPLCTNPWSHHAFKHSSASIRSSPRAFLSGVMSFLALLKTLSHSQEIAGQDKVSNAHCRILRRSSCAHQAIGLKVAIAGVMVPLPKSCAARVSVPIALLKPSSESRTNSIGSNEGIARF